MSPAFRVTLIIATITSITVGAEGLGFRLQSLGFIATITTRLMYKKMEATIAHWGYIGIMEKKGTSYNEYCYYSYYFQHYYY